QWLGASRVLGGLCYIGAALDSHGDVRHIGATPGITFGEISGERSARAKAILEVLGRTTIAAVLSDNIIQAMWEKLVMLASMAVVTTLTRAVIGEIMAARTGESFARAALAECEAVAAAEGHPSTAPAIERTRLMLMTRGSPLTSSMMRDLVAGGRTEGDHVIGDMVRRAQARGMETPLLTAALCNLDIHEAKRVGASS
ncbi:MAG TPA: ketopantoate reductase C-terminal domain-containing protein, partial [Stellaceae bacterium]|nr:ketopantoate reductase C-terminal domain-containing protein [Stellaceae bacterium]